MKLLITFVLIMALRQLTTHAQTLYLNGGAASIGSSANTRVGIGNSNPEKNLQVDGGSTGSSIMLGNTTSSSRTSMWLLTDGSSGVATIQSWWAGVNQGVLSLNPSGGKVGIGTTAPERNFQVDGGSSGSAMMLGSTTTQSRTSMWLSTDGSSGNATIQSWWAGVNQGALLLNPSGGNVGIGTISPPSAKLHVVGSGTNIDGGNSNIISGDLVVQSNTGGRSTTTGAQLEFVIPANTDGSNFWGQGRIITVAGNSNNFDATGKMILGTRRMFNKQGSGSQWYYGNDLTIDAAGRVGIGTTLPDAPLAVKGQVHANEVKVDLNVPGPDYVFASDYKLPSLEEIKTYIDENRHLPEVPSAKEMEKNGVQLGEMNMLLLKKIEELTLYVIELKKEVKELRENQEPKK